MNALKINIIIIFLFISPFFYNIYPQSYTQFDVSFSYYKFLPYFERFKSDSVEAILYKANKIKSVSVSAQTYRYGNYEKSIVSEKSEFDREGFLIKKTNPGIQVYINGYISANEDNRLDSTTYLYDKKNNKVLEFYCIRKYPETTIWQFDTLGRINYVEKKRDSIIIWNKIINYDLVNNQIVTIDTNEFYRINGKIYEIYDNKVSRVLDYGNKDTVPSEIYTYGKDKLTIKEYENGNIHRITTRYFNPKGRLIKEIREISDKDVVVEEFIYGINYIKYYSYKREIESYFSIFKSISQSISYFHENGLPEMKLSKWWNFGYVKQEYIYEYYE